MSKKMKAPDFIVGDVYDEGIASLPKESRIDNLESISYSVKEIGYTKNLTDDELAEKKTSLAEVSIELNELEEEKKRLTEEIKLQMKLPKQEKMILLQTIKHKTEYRNGTIFSMDDQEAGVMYLFDSDAVCVEVRPLHKEEKQMVLKMTKKTGTDGE